MGEGGVLERFLVGLQGFIPSRRGGQEEREHLDDHALFVLLLGGELACSTVAFWALQFSPSPNPTTIFFLAMAEERSGIASRAQMNRLVMNYLVLQGHREAAESFAGESATCVGADLETVGHRRRILAAVHSGDIAAAEQRADELVPGVLAGDADLRFAVQQQRLIELIRAGDDDASLDFACDELAPLAEAEPRFLPELERTMMLLAARDCRQSPEAGLLEAAQRERVAAQLNAALLSAERQDREAALPVTLRLLQRAQAQLRDHHVRFPALDNEGRPVPRSPGPSELGREPVG